MITTLTNLVNLHMLLPETLWLEPEHFAQAQRQSDRFTDESVQWRAYLQTLAQLSFQDWLQAKLPNCRLSPIKELTGTPNAAIGYLNANDFELCVVATEHVLDELVKIPCAAVDRPEYCAHFYVLIEVLEDQQEAVVRGFLRYDELIAYLSQATVIQSRSESSESSLAPSASPNSMASEYCLPLSCLDSEPNHLVSYIQQLSPNAIALPASTAEPSVEPSTEPSIAVASAVGRLSALTTRLGLWIEGSLTAGWQTLDSLVNPEMTLVLATRGSSSETKAGKLINLGFQAEPQEVVLLMNVIPEADNKIRVQVQVLPTGDRQVIPAQLSVALISSKGKVLQSVTARDQDNFIQLRSFKGESGVRFSIELTLNDVQVKEDFEL